MPRQASLEQHLMTKPVMLNHDASVLQAMEVASNFVGETIPVVNEENGLMVGVVSEANIFDAIWRPSHKYTILSMVEITITRINH